MLGLAVASEVSAQIISGDLVGIVFDKTGAVVPNAAVEAVNTETGVKYTTKANAGGEYRFNNLPVGTYNVSASSTNFATTTINGFAVELNKTSTLQITLEIKGAVTTVEVSGAAQAEPSLQAGRRRVGSGGEARHPPPRLQDRGRSRPASGVGSLHRPACVHLSTPAPTGAAPAEEMP